MPKRREALIAAVPLGVGATSPPPARPRLRFSLGQSWGAPFLERAGTRVLGGILPDLMTAIAAEMGLAPEFVLLPNVRVDRALENGDVDLHCLLSPSWAPEVKDPTRWSVPVMPMRDVLVGLAGGPRTLGEMAKGGPWPVGLVRGYRYPTLEPLLAQGRLVREDAPDQWAALGKLVRERTPLAVANEYTLHAFKRRQGGARLQRVAVVEEVQGHCLLSLRPGHPRAEILAAVRAAVERGRIEAVLQPYRDEVSPPRSGASTPSAPRRNAAPKPPPPA